MLNKRVNVFLLSAAASLFLCLVAYGQNLSEADSIAMPTLETQKESSMESLTEPANGARFVEIKDLTGEVKVKAAPGESWKVAKEGQRVFAGGEIKTGRDSSATIWVDEKGASGKIDLRSNTWVRVAALDFSEKDNSKKTLIDLALGQVLVFAEKLQGKSTFQVRTPTATSSVHGEKAIFEVHVEEDSN